MKTIVDFSQVVSRGQVRDTDGGREGSTWHHTNFGRCPFSVKNFLSFFVLENLLHELIWPLLEYFQYMGFHLLCEAVHCFARGFYY